METCDACGPAVSAKVIVSLPSGRTLTYCFHHATQYRVALSDMGAFIYTLSDQVTTSA